MVKTDADNETHAESGDANKRGTERRARMKWAIPAGQRDGHWAVRDVSLTLTRPVKTQCGTGPREGERNVPDAALPVAHMDVLGVPVAGLARTRNVIR